MVGALVVLLVYGQYSEHTSGSGDFLLLGGGDFLLLDNSNFLLL
jgi:hypothetical protein